MAAAAHEGDGEAPPAPTDPAAPASLAADPSDAPVVLPAAIRSRVVGYAAETLGTLTLDEVPATLRPFRSFAPAKRARLAATPLASVVDDDAIFRSRVAALVRSAVPALALALDAGHAPAAADPVDVATAAYLLRPEGWGALLRAAVHELEHASAAAGDVAASAEVARLTALLATQRAQGRADVERLRAELAVVKAEVTDLRRRLHTAREARRAAEEVAEAARREAATTTASADAELRRIKARLAEADSAVETGRRHVREGRSAADTRLRLLLDTILESTTGLRRELALAPAAPDSPRPADSVVAAVPGVSGVDAVAGQARASDDPGLLDALLALPQVHLVVDGYNVTKLGFGSLPLQMQRERLVTGLAAVAARSGAEVTCCFDGADVDAPVVMSVPRGVRVLFSLPGETADELIRRLVAHEPQGRPVVVVSTDKEVADGVRRNGARAVPSAMRLRRLATG